MNKLYVRLTEGPMHWFYETVEPYKGGFKVRLGAWNKELTQYNCECVHGSWHRWTKRNVAKGIICKHAKAAREEICKRQ